MVYQEYVKHLPFLPAKSNKLVQNYLYTTHFFGTKYSHYRTMDYNQSHPLYFPFEHSLHELDILVLWLNIQMHNNPWLGLIHLITKIPIELKLPFYLEKQSSQLLHELCLTKVARSSISHEIFFHSLWQTFLKGPALPAYRCLCSQNIKIY